MSELRIKYCKSNDELNNMYSKLEEQKKIVDENYRNYVLEELLKTKSFLIYIDSAEIVKPFPKNYHLVDAILFVPKNEQKTKYDLDNSWVNYDKDVYLEFCKLNVEGNRSTEYNFVKYGTINFNKYVNKKIIKTKKHEKTIIGPSGVKDYLSYLINDMNSKIKCPENEYLHQDICPVCNRLHCADHIEFPCAIFITHLIIEG